MVSYAFLPAFMASLFLTLFVANPRFRRMSVSLFTVKSSILAKKILFRDYSRKIFDFWRVPIRTFLGPKSASGRPIAPAYA